MSVYNPEIWWSWEWWTCISCLFLFGFETYWIIFLTNWRVYVKLPVTKIHIVWLILINSFILLSGYTHISVLSNNQQFALYSTLHVLFCSIIKMNTLLTEIMDFASEVGKMIHTMTQYEVRETTLYHIILSLLWITSPIRCKGLPVEGLTYKSLFLNWRCKCSCNTDSRNSVTDYCSYTFSLMTW